MRTEFEFISDLKTRYGLKHVGDDCSVLPKDCDTDMVVTADMLVESVDFRPDWTTPESLGHKALAVSLSDIAAMGAVPEWAMVSLAMPEELWNSGSIEQFYEGWFVLAREYGVELVGGDISRTPGPLVIDSIVGGNVARGRAILRSGAIPGDSIYVTGSLGGAAGGLALLEAGQKDIDSARYLYRRQLKPQPQLVLANELQQLGLTTAMIDVSDGFSSDLTHICKASGVGARIYSNLLPIDIGLQLHFSHEDSLQMALNGGEDFELIFTSREQDIRLSEKHTITQIGEITASVGIIELISDGKCSILESKGYRHF